MVAQISWEQYMNQMLKTLFFVRNPSLRFFCLADEKAVEAFCASIRLPALTVIVKKYRSFPLSHYNNSKTKISNVLKEHFFASKNVGKHKEKHHDSVFLKRYFTTGKKRTKLYVCLSTQKKIFD